MPYMVQGNLDNQVSLSNLSGDLGYDYPNELDLRPNSKLSKLIVNEVCQRARESHAEMSKRHSSWKKMDDVLKGYIPLSDEEKKIQQDNPNKPVSIIFPYTYAIKETLLTYAMSALVQDPIFQYAGVGPEDTIGAILLEKKIQMDCQKSKVALALHTMLSDAMAYGIGIATPGWFERRGNQYSQPEEGLIKMVMNRFMGRGQSEITQTNALLYEGNKLETIDPYQVLPDPNVSCHKIQDGDFYGWVYEISKVNLLGIEQQDEDYFNVRYLNEVNNLRSQITTTNRDKPDRDSITAVKIVDVINMYINLIPRDWELGDSEYPEKWEFAVAADSIVIKAKPLGLTHNMYPIATIAPDYDGYSVAPLSRLEMLQGLQTTIDWLFNSHIANVRKAINDMLIVDPFMINMKDLQSPEPGKLIRLNRPGWGKGVKDAVHQLQINDITRQNISDTSWIVNWMNHVSGVDEAMMGSLRQGGPERLTGTEFSGTRQSALSRLNKMTQLMAIQGMQDIAYFFACHTQQLMTQETYVKSTGEWPELLAKEYGRVGDVVKVSPANLMIDFDVVCRNGTIPGNQSSDAWLRMMDILMKDPEARQEFNMPQIFKHIAREMGEKNVDDFIRKVPPINAQVMPDQQVMQQVQAGNLVPMGG